MNLQALALAFMAAAAIGGLAWVFIYPILSGERQAEQRRANFTKAEPVARRAERAQQRSRREQVEQTLREVENRHRKATKLSLSTRIEMAGLSWSKQQFFIISGVLGGIVFFVILVLGMGLFAAVALGFAAGFGVPRWLLGWLKKRRERKFLDALPDAVDIIVRGIKAGLPLFDSIKVVAVDAPDPLRSEFAAIVETQAVGMPLGDACLRLFERMPLPEANFFGIVVSIQQKAGGNLSEALGNLSKVLRDRKRMAGKIRAMSMEAKASAAIIGSIPPVIMFLVYLMTPGYISLLWTTQIGHLMLAGSAVWMTIGVLVMRKMINFDF
jgi:tight adherence protein B